MMSSTRASRGRGFLLESELLLILLLLCGMLSVFGTSEPHTLSATTDHDSHDTNYEILRNVALGTCFARCNPSNASCWDDCQHNHTAETNYYWAPGPRSHFSHKPEVTVLPQGNVVFRWFDVINESPYGMDQKSLVYGVFWSSDKNNWTCLYLNTSEECELDAAVLMPHQRPRLLVSAMSREGVVAEETFFPQLPGRPAGGPRERSSDDGGPVRVTVSTRNATLRVCVRWTSGMRRVSHYTVHWARENCRADPAFPACDEPPHARATTLPATQNTTQKYCLPWKSLTFNSRYWAQVDYGAAEGERVNFVTPGCRVPDRSTFTRCYNTTTAQNRHNTPMGSQALNYYKVSISNHTSIQRLRQTEYYVTFARYYSVHDVYLPWHINFTCLAMHADSGKVLVKLRWQLPRQYHLWPGVMYKVITLRMYTSHIDLNDNRLFAYANNTNQSFIDVTLRPHSDYTFQVKATVKRRGVGTMTFVSSYLIINTTTILREYSNETCREYQASVEHLSTSAAAVSWYLLLTLLAVGGMLMLTSTTILMLRRFNRLQFTIRMATLRATSNSYKSSLELADSIETELLCRNDQWEVNPKDVQICTELGRGAFGRVMTGLHNNVKVAIKILKEDAATSYREDLISEISLMKDLGQHPNIVLLIGACTQREPVALILEYMPYGNLQSFLTKCRTEGKVMYPSAQGSDDRSVVYAVIDEDGEVDQWTIAPVDLLSFARQVTKAMEYLAERHVLHRDLAARNVLLGFHKVVKISDFGLARTVSQPGDVYHKLTAGKLPLKWMALESLQERMFTSASDVWSFGVFLWELVTMGASPYPGIALADLFVMLASGYRMEKPRNCSDSLYELMLRSWLENARDRPTFTDLRLTLEEMLAKDSDYLDLENIDIHVYQSASSSCDTSNPHQMVAQCVPVILHHVPDSALETQDSAQSQQ